MSAEVALLLVFSAPAVAIVVSVLGVSLVARLLPWWLPGKPRSGELAELVRLLEQYELDEGRLTWRVVLGLRLSECDLDKAETAYHERLALLQACAPRPQA